MSASGRGEDLELIERVKAKEAGAFAELTHRYSGEVFRLAMGMVRNDQDARDVVQETFLAVFRRLEGFRGESSFRTWLLRIATNFALMKLRRRRRKPESSLRIETLHDDEGAVELDPVDLRPLADKVHHDRRLAELVREAVDALPDAHREVLVLADYQGLSMLEIADQLDLSVPNVKTRLHRARLAVRAHLRARLGGEPL